MKRHYFIGEGPEAKALFDKTWARFNACNDARNKLCKEYEADMLVTTDPGPVSGGKVVGLWFREAVFRPYLKGGEYRDGGYIYSPNRRTKEGRALAKRLEEDESLTFSCSSFILKELGINRIVFENLTMYWCTAGFAGDKVLLTVPGPKEPVEGVDPWPEIPAWFREVKKSKFLKAQGE